MNTDLRQEFWHCLRFWLFDYRYFGLSPFPLTDEYGFSPAAFHALSHWKLWMEQKPAFAGVRLEARYKRSVYNDRNSKYEPMHIPPDKGEEDHHDYLLCKTGDPGVLCAVECEYGMEVHHVTEDLGKLIQVHSSLKVMIYRMNYPDCLHPEEGFAQRRRAIEASITANPDANLAREDWLFIGYPYYRKPYPKRAEQTFVRLYTLTTPSESISLVEPEWDIWQPAAEMDQWFRSLYAPAGRSTGGA